MFSAISNVTIEENLAAALTSVPLWTMIAETFLLIFLGAWLSKTSLLPINTADLLSKIVMSVALPCLAFSSFMTDFSLAEGYEAFINFVLSFALYLFFIALGKYVFFWVKDPTKRMVLGILFAFGGTTFFSQPVILQAFSLRTYNDSNIQNIPFRLFLYSYAYYQVSGLHCPKGDRTQRKKTMRKLLLNPILLATLFGFFLWLLQAVPGSNEARWWTIRSDFWSPSASLENVDYVPFWRFDVSLPWLHQVAKTLGGLSAPLIWLAIGCTLGSVSFKAAFSDREAWNYAVLKVFFAPALVLGILAALEAIGRSFGIPSLISLYTLQCTVLMWMAPPATVAMAYCISFDKEKTLASDANLVSTLLAIPGLVVWIVVVTAVGATGFFPA